MRATELAVVLALSLVTPSFAASDAPSAAATLESVAIMRVAAKVVIEPGGGLGDLRIETPLRPALQAALENVIRGWRFKPVHVDGVARRASTRMLVVLALLQDGDKRRIVIDSVDFPTDTGADVVAADGQLAPITANRLGVPVYPPNQQQAHVMGTVLLGIRVKPDGRAGDVAVMQSMLFATKRGEKADRRSLHEFEGVALAASRRWTFNVPESAVPRTVEQMTVNVPVQFNLGYALDAPGQWLAVVRLPKQPLPWLPLAPGTPRLGVASMTGNDVSPNTSVFGLSLDVVGTSLK